jgi:hypothetical protein
MLLALAAAGTVAAPAGAADDPLAIAPLFSLTAASGNGFDDAGAGIASLPVPAAAQLMATAHVLARARWGVDACGGAVDESWQHLGASINAQSRWMAADQADAATYTSCEIDYNVDVSWDWPKLCTIVEHELGHLTGHAHVADPTNVMSPYYVQPSPECAATPQPGAAAATAPVVAPASTRAAATTSKAAKRDKSQRRVRAARARRASRR